MRPDRTEQRLRSMPPDYFSRAVQSRLLMLTGMLLLVMIMAQRAGQPETWAWMWNGQNRILKDETPLPVGQDQWHPNLDRSLLTSVKDNTHFRQVERASWSHLIQLLHESPVSELQSYSLGPTSYLQLNRQTNEYRGRLVDIRGTVRRAHRLAAPDNEAGVRHYWQCWLFTENGPSRPIVVYVLDVPVDFSGGMQIDVPATLTGFVYKRWAFQSAEQLTVAPVVIAKKIANILTTPTTLEPLAKERVPAQMPLVIAVTGLAAVVVTTCLFRWTAKLNRRHRTERDASELNWPDDRGTGPPSHPKIDGPG